MCDQCADNSCEGASAHFVFMGKQILTEQDFERAALELLCDVPAIKAVAEVESAQNGFLPDGRPVILFERHKFHQFTKGAYYLTHPSICNPERGGYIGKAGEWDRYDQAQGLDANAAALSTSWGKFQIMGFNYEACRFSTVGEFVNAMCESEGRQLDAFVNFIKSRGLDDDLRERNWATFARVYNGPKYRENQYDDKMAAAYQKYARLRPGTRDLRPKIEMVFDAPEQSAAESPKHSPAIVSRPEDEPMRATQNGGKAWFTLLSAWATAIGGGTWATLTSNPDLLRTVRTVVIVVTIAAFVRWIITDGLRLWLQAHPGRFNVR